MQSTGSKTIQEAGEQTMLLHSFYSSFSPELMLLAKISSQCNQDQEFRSHFLEEDLEVLGLLLEHFMALTRIVSPPTLTDEEKRHIREVMSRQ